MIARNTIVVPCIADQEEGERRHAVEDADALVVDGGDPRPGDGDGGRARRGRDPREESLVRGRGHFRLSR
jgi:hypothetical protein